MLACHACALRIVESHMHMAASSLLTYYGVHVIHQLTQAGRTLVAILLNCKTEDLKPLVPASLEALKSCVGLLRRFSGRYVCGLRNGDLIEEFCRLTRIPLDTPQGPIHPSRPAWLRPVPKKSSQMLNSAATRNGGGSTDSRESSDASSPAGGMDGHLYTSSPPFSHTQLSPESQYPPFSPTAPTDPVSAASTYIDPTTGVTPVLPDSSISPAEFMALLNDQNGGFDMGSMFHPGMVQQPQQHHPGNLSPTFMNGMNGVGVLSSP